MNLKEMVSVGMALGSMSRLCSIWMLVAIVIGMSQYVIGQAVANEAEETDAAVALSEDLVADLISAMDGETMAERDEAEEKIVALGAGVIPLLPKIDDNTSAELRLRLQRITDTLRSQRVQQFVEPSKVNLTGTMTVKEALEAITEQTGNEFTWNDELSLSMEVTPAMSDLGFWEALDEILDQADLGATAYGSEMGKLEIIPNATYSGRSSNAFYSNVFRLSPVRVVSSTVFNRQDQNSLKLTIGIAWEPRMEPVYFQFPMDKLVVQSDLDDVIEAYNETARPEVSPQGLGSQIEVELMLKKPPRSAKKIQTVKGEFTVALPGETVSLEFDELQKPGRKIQEVANLSVQIDSIRKNGSVYEFRTQVRMLGATQTLDSFRGWLMNNEGYILDQAGKRIDNAGWSVFKSGGNEVGISYLFSLSEDLATYRFLYDAPGLVSEQNVEFELQDILLP